MQGDSELTYRRIVTGFVLATTLLCGHAARAADTIAPQAVDGKIKWVYSLAEARREARAGGKPMFVVFRCER